MAYIVKSSAARMPAGCWGRYRHVAVLEVEDGTDQVSMISDRARGVLRVVETWPNQNVGKTSNCAYRRALREAADLVQRLNAQAEANAALADDPIPGDYDLK